MNTREICDVCGGIGEACVCLCEPASSSLQQHGSAARIENLLDAAFGVLAHDCDPEDYGSIKQRQSLKIKFEKILRMRHNEKLRHGGENQ